MKKTIVSILMGCLLIASTYAKIVVCYFSCTGNTKTLAQSAAKALDVELFEIVPEVPYKAEDIDWHNSNSRSSNKCNDKTNRPAIKSKIDLSKYDTVILAFPIWWNSAPQIMWNFVEQNDLSGKTVVPICTSGSSSALKATPSI